MNIRSRISDETVLKIPCPSREWTVMLVCKGAYGRMLHQIIWANSSQGADPTRNCGGL